MTSKPKGIIYALAIIALLESVTSNLLFKLSDPGKSYSSSQSTCSNSGETGLVCCACAISIKVTGGMNSQFRNLIFVLGNSNNSFTIQKKKSGLFSKSSLSFRKLKCLYIFFRILSDTNNIFQENIQIGQSSSNILYLLVFLPTN